MSTTHPPAPPAVSRAGTTPTTPATPTSPAALAEVTDAAVRRNTPARMRALAFAMVLVGLLVGVAAGWSFMTADNALGRANANAAQLVRLQELQTRFVAADAGATNAFLVGGLEPADQRADYDDALATVTQLVAQAAKAQPADGAVLSQLNTTVLDYASDVERARAANRQGLPVGAQYLRNASAQLRAEALPALAALIDANSARVEAEFDAASGARTWAVTAGVLAIVVTAAAGVWLARRTHRYINPPLATAGVILVGLTIASGVSLGSVSAQVDDVSEVQYAATKALSDARLAAFDAKSNESLTLIARGTGAAFEEAWQTSADATVDRLNASTVWDGTGLREAWAQYQTAHADIRALDDGGDWDEAVAAATDRSPESANAAFSAFDDATSDQLTRASTETTDALARAGRGLAVGLWLSLAAGLGVALLSYSGISRRIEEYR